MSLSDENEKLSEEVGKLLILQLAEAKKRGCSIEGCLEPATGIGDKNPYCNRHFWEEFDKRYPE